MELTNKNMTEVTPAAEAVWHAYETAPEGPIPESELADMWNQQADSFNQWESLDSGEQLEWAQARAIARCVRPAIKPVSVAERLPGPEHCDAEGQSWWYHPETMSCVACWCYSRGNGTEKHWLPHHALPLPTNKQ